MGWTYMPDPPALPTHREREYDPLKIWQKFQRFLEKEDKKKKDKEKEKDHKKSEPWDQVMQLGVMLMITSVIIGPAVFTVWSMLRSTH